MCESALEASHSLTSFILNLPRGVYKVLCILLPGRWEKYQGGGEEGKVKGKEKEKKGKWKGEFKKGMFTV